MPLYRVGVRTPAAAFGAPYADLVATAARRARVREISVTLAAATATPFGIIRASTVGTATTTAAGQLTDAADTLASTGLVGTAWSTPPTIGALYLDRKTFPASVGAGYTWTFGRDELVIPISASLVLWNFDGAAAGSACDVTWVWEE